MPKRTVSFSPLQPQAPDLPRASSPRRCFVFLLVFLLSLTSAFASSLLAQSHGVRTLVLVRHGAYDGDDPRDESVGKALLPIGVAQARLAGDRLRSLPYAFDAIFASPFTRARETAQVIAGELQLDRAAGSPSPALTVRVDPDLAECTPPTRRADIMAGEKPADLAACEVQLDRLAARLFLPSPDADRHELVVAHGNIIRSLVVRALGVDPLSWLSMSIGHASLTVITVDATGAVRVIAVGDVGHLPPGMQTGAFGDRAPELQVPQLAMNAAGAGVAAIDRPIVFLISFDGFRWDYPELHGAPNILALAASGVRAASLVPSFPSKTYPNHYTLVTGLRPEHHGVISNTMWDAEWKAQFSLNDRAAVGDGRWWEGEPIWVDAERHGVVSASSLWPGSEAAISGIRPTYWRTFDSAVADETRVQEILGWLDLPVEKRPHLVTIYFDQPDSAGHSFGPTAAETGAAVAHVDEMLGKLRAGVAARGLDGAVDWILVSDHGMTPTDPKKTIALADFVDVADFSPWTSVDSMATFGLIDPMPGKEAALLKALKNAHPHLHAAAKGEMPEALHFRAHRRIPPIVIWADAGWTIFSTRTDRDAAQAKFVRGSHGYDPAIADMHGLFVAAGPSFRKGLKTPPLDNVDVYPLLARLLGLPPAPNDGNVKSTDVMLVDGTP
ncbi:MAG: alkaline phosphatase family protein [Thermoanaerobaculia bacterium]